MCVFEVMREMLYKVLECICLHKGFHSALGSVYIYIFVDPIAFVLCALGSRYTLGLSTL